MGAIDTRRLTREITFGDWEKAVDAYRRSRAAAKSLEEEYARSTDQVEGEIEPLLDSLVNDWDAAMQTLLFFEAPSVAAVAIKARVVADDGVSDLDIAPAVAQAIAADLERLAA
jgi:hypothetical protein